MKYGISALKDALQLRLGNRQKISFDDRRKHVDAILEFGAPGWIFSPDWTMLADCRAAIFEPDQQSGNGCILYVHGGAFVAGSPRSHAYLAAGLAKAAGQRVYALDYRLAPEHPFPAAVDDVIAAVTALTDGHQGPLSLVGDSAGGTLVLLAAQTKRVDRKKLGPIALISPVVDLRCEGGTYVSHASLDPFINQSGLKQDVDCFLAGAGAERQDISPIHGDFSDFPPLLIQVGSNEVLLGDAIALENVVRKSGGRVTLRIWTDMIHVWHLFPQYLEQSDAAIIEIADFLNAFV